MLLYGTVEPATLAILKKIMSLPETENFLLVGGTALALYYGHRKSIDLDLFSFAEFDAETLIPILGKYFPDFTYSRPNALGIFGFIGNVKVDFVRYAQIPLIDTPYFQDGLRLISIDDIIAMKVSAVLKRAVKKDFWDIAELLEHYTLEQIIVCYNKKYPSHQLLISIPQALTYFADAEDSEDPVGLKGQTWNSVKKKIQKKVAEYLHN